MSLPISFREVEMQAIVLAIRQENADAILDGTRDADHRALPPKRLPARAYLAVVGSGTIVGECVLGKPSARTAKGWTLPVTRVRRYRKPRPIGDFGLTKTPRSFRYVDR